MSKMQIFNGFSSCSIVAFFLSASAVQQAQDVDQLKGKVAIEATKDAWNHAASATHLFIWPVGVAAVNWASWLKLFYLS